MLPTTKVSLAVPYHDTPHTAFYLARLFKSLDEQTFKDYEIVLTKEGAFARNHNAALIKCRGEIVQFMGIDDYFAHPQALQNIVDGFTQDTAWQITACLHNQDGVVGWPHYPYWTDDIYTGNNRLGGVSTLSVLREKAITFEEPLSWLVDVDIYYRLFLKYGIPKLGTTLDIVVNTTMHRTSNTLSDDIKRGEVEYLTKKYG